ncbi:MAG: hypothetical protein WBM75_20755 [Polyangiales bacterium]
MIGSAIGLKVMEDVSYISGMDRFIKGVDEQSSGYLKDLFGHDPAVKIVCIPQTIGSSSAATGILMGDNWLCKRIVTVDSLADEFLDAVKTGDKVRVDEDGSRTLASLGR